jgi:hypothetical protein
MEIQSFDLIGRGLAYLARTDLRVLFLALLVLLVAVSEIGFRLGRRAEARHAARVEAGTATGEKESVGFVTAGMLGLVAFLLGVSLSMGQARYDDRRNVVRDEANAIGTAWLRAPFAGEQEGLRMRALLHEYTELRISMVRAPLSMRESGPLARINALQSEMWALAMSASLARPDPIRASLIGSLNDMFDLSLSTRRAFYSRIPIGVMQMLLWATLIAVGVVGYNFGLAGSRQPMVGVLLLVFWSSALVLIVDINNPEHGVVVVDPAPLVWTLQGFGPAAPR